MTTTHEFPRIQRNYNPSRKHRDLHGVLKLRLLHVANVTTPTDQTSPAMQAPHANPVVFRTPVSRIVTGRIPPRFRREPCYSVCILPLPWPPNVLTLACNVEAWHIVTTTDPLIDSDDEDADDHVRIDCRSCLTFFLFESPSVMCFIQFASSISCPE